MQNYVIAFSGWSRGDNLSINVHQIEDIIFSLMKDVEYLVSSCVRIPASVNGMELFAKILQSNLALQ